MSSNLLGKTVGCLAIGTLFAFGLQAQAPFDLVIANGRAMDPESKLDATRHIGIRNGRIAAISPTPLPGRKTIDAKGLVVTSGFIDLHSHGQSDENYRYKARDGVTTALEMEVGVSPVKPWIAERQGKALIHFGATVGHIPTRMAAVGDNSDWLPRGPAATRAATQAEQEKTLALIRQGLRDGGLGVGMGIAYTPFASRSEILDVFKVSAAAGGARLEGGGAKATRRPAPRLCCDVALWPLARRDARRRSMHAGGVSPGYFSLNARVPARPGR